jgi:RNA polymerase sigma factor for flagellar operon FliA
VQEKLTSTKKKIDGAREELRISTGHYPDDIDVARMIGLSLTALVEAEEAFKLSQAVSFDSYIEENIRLSKAPESVRPQRFEKNELSLRLKSSMALLTKEEQKVILMFYYEDLTQREIAGVLDISEDEVASIHVSAMSKMQAEMLEYMDIFINAV